MIRRACVLLLFGAIAGAETADEIMARVAENQDRAESLRTAYVYRQRLVHRVKKMNGTLAGEQVREFDMIPGPAGVEKKLIASSSMGEGTGMSMRMEFNDNVHVDFASSMLVDDQARDGVDPRLFPLTASEQRHYRFQFKGREKFHGAEVYRVHFEPEKDSCWAGDVLIDAGEYQPILMETRLAKGIPFAAQLVLGTNMKGFGFRLAYRKFEDGVWFPVEYDADFTLRALFVHRRRISFSMKNTGFRRTDVQSNVTFAN